MGAARQKKPVAATGTMGWVIHTERMKRGWTQKDLEHKCRGLIKQSRISSLESGRKTEIKAQALHALADAFELDAEELRNGRSVPRRIAGVGSEEVRHLDQMLNPTNHAKWVAYGNGLLDGQQPSKPHPPRPDRPSRGAGFDNRGRAGNDD